MAKNKKDLDLAESSKLNRISGGTNAIFNIIFILLALVCIIPVLLHRTVIVLFRKYFHWMLINS